MPTTDSSDVEKTTIETVPEPQAAPAPASTSRAKGFWDSVSIYGLELAVAMITIIILASVLSSGAFALCRYFYDSGNAVLGQASLWTAASAIVWLPIALIFYVRSRGYMNQNPQVVNSGVQRTFVMIYQVIMLITVISFAFTAVGSFLYGLTKVGGMGEVLVGTALPAALSAVIFFGAFIAFFRKPLTSRKLFAWMMLGASLVIVLPTIVYSIISLRSVAADQDRVADLSKIHDGVRDYYSAERKLPSSLSAVDGKRALELKRSLSDYEYNKKDGTEYELCTEFVSDTKKGDSSRSSSSTYQNFSRHGKGKHCFTQAAGYDYGRNTPYMLDDY